MKITRNLGSICNLWLNVLINNGPLVPETFCREENNSKKSILGKQNRINLVNNGVLRKHDLMRIT